MKTFTCIFFSLILAVSVKGQNEPELVGLVEGANIGTKFEYIDHGMPKIIVSNYPVVSVYNMDLSLHTSFEIPDDGFNVGALYVTRSLFDCDTTNIEYLVSGGNSDSSYTRIYRENGTLILDLPGYGFYSSTSLTSNDAGMVSDENGSYMTFWSGFSTNEFVMYRFCGQVPQPLARESDGTILSGIMQEGGNSGFHTYPNPTRDIIRFEYDLEGHQKANLQIFNTSGQLVKDLMLGPAFDHIRLNVSELEEGTYIARIVTEDGFELSEKFVKVE